MRPSFFALAAVFVMSLATTRSAEAQDTRKKKPATADADTLFREGRRLLQAGDVAAACPKFEESYRLDPAPGTLLNIADCDERSGKLTQAWQHFHNAALTLRDDRVPIAQKRADNLQKKLVIVNVKLPADAPPGTRALQDEVDLPPASLNVDRALTPGRHTFRLGGAAAGNVLTLDLKEGERRDIVLELPPPPVTAKASTTSAALPPSPPPQIANDDTPAPPTKRGIADDPKLPAYAAFGVGGLGLIFATVGLWQTLDAKSDVDALCPNKVCTTQEGIDAASRGTTFNVVMIAGMIVTVLGAGAGTYLLFHPAPWQRRAASGVFFNPSGLAGTF